MANLFSENIYENQSLARSILYANKQGVLCLIKYFGLVADLR